MRIISYLEKLESNSYFRIINQPIPIRIISSLPALRHLLVGGYGRRTVGTPSATLSRTLNIHHPDKTRKPKRKAKPPTMSLSASVEPVSLLSAFDRVSFSMDARKVRNPNTQNRNSTSGYDPWLVDTYIKSQLLNNSQVLAKSSELGCLVTQGCLVPPYFFIMLVATGSSKPLTALLIYGTQHWGVVYSI